MLSAVLFKDLCLSEEVPCVFILSCVTCEPLNTKLIFSPQLLDMLSQLDPQITARNKAFVAFNC